MAQRISISISSIIIIIVLAAVTSTTRVLTRCTTGLSFEDENGHIMNVSFNSHPLQPTVILDRFNRLQTPPKNIYVLGERNSGTNYVANILRNAFEPPNNDRSHEIFSSDIPVLKHKHMFRHSLLNEDELAEIANRTDILWILTVRSPCDWAEGMYRMPWHMCPPKNIDFGCPGNFIRMQYKQLLHHFTLQEFFEMEWGDWPESTNYRNISFPGDDFIYKNVFELRQHKLRLMKQIIDTVPRNVKIARLHEIERSPEAFLQNIVLEFGLDRKEGYEKPSQKMHTEKCLKSGEWEIAQREVDWSLEGDFGYNFLDCHMCYTSPKGKSSPPEFVERVGDKKR